MRSLLAALLGTFVSACSSGSNSNLPDSGVVNGYFVSSATLTIQNQDRLTADYTSTSIRTYSLSDSENAITNTVVTDGVPYRDEVTSFDDSGSILKRRYAGPSTNILTDEPYDVIYKNTYNENGLLIRTDFETHYVLYEYQNNRLIKRENYSATTNRFQYESRLTYDTSGFLETVSKFIKDEQSLEWVMLDRCSYSNVNGHRIAHHCEHFNPISNTSYTSSTGTYEYDDVGNLIVFVDIISNNSGNLQTLTSNYEYEQSDRTVPNFLLFHQLYFEAI